MTAVVSIRRRKPIPQRICTILYGVAGLCCGVKSDKPDLDGTLQNTFPPVTRGKATNNVPAILISGGANILYFYSSRGGSFSSLRGRSLTTSSDAGNTVV